MALFHIRETFAHPDKPTFVIIGFLVEGEVVPGMLINIPFNTTINLTAKIDRVDVFRRPDGEIVSLGIDCIHPDEVTLWQALNLADRVIQIAAPA